MLEYLAHHPDPDGGARDRVLAFLDREATTRGRALAYSSLTSDTGLRAALAAADVLYVHNQILDAAAARSIATFWRDDLLDFLRDGGVVVVPSQAPGRARAAGTSTCWSKATASSASGALRQASGP